VWLRQTKTTTGHIAVSRLAAICPLHTHTHTHARTHTHTRQSHFPPHLPLKADAATWVVVPVPLLLPPLPGRIEALSGGNKTGYSGRCSSHPFFPNQGFPETPSNRSLCSRTERTCMRTLTEDSPLVMAVPLLAPTIFDASRPPSDPNIRQGMVATQPYVTNQRGSLATTLGAIP